MTAKNKAFITTAIDYTNAQIHVGQAYEKILADCFARFQRLKKGKENVFFTTGTDEHGTTNEKAAKKEGISTSEFVTQISLKDKTQIDSLNISYDRFIRTTDEDHIKTASEFFKKSFDNGDIYKASYEGYYCEGCEAYKTLTELNENGQCPLHTTREIQKLEEENYFFKWSKYTDFLRELVSSKTFVVPEGKRKEMLSFIESGINDIPVTRPKFKLDWGITSPIDDNQVIYVWFDALINYITSGFPLGFWDEDTEIVHFVGKDIARWHVLLWPAMLKSAGYRVPDSVCVHGFLNLNGEKISKSKGNVIYPTEIVEKFGTDAVRYYFLRYGPIVEDSDISETHLKDIYNGELANGLGNTVARVAKLAENSGFEFEKVDTVFSQVIKDFRTDQALSGIWARLTELDKHINENAPWALEDRVKLKEVLTYEVNEIRKIAPNLEPFIPETAEKIRSQFGQEKIKSEKPLFPRIN
ncbi:MAG: class I tRNA ligase family protein [Patescibacteria group bacterium]|jgi:methionyl-tRNA synthetase